MNTNYNNSLLLQHHLQQQQHQNSQQGGQQPQQQQQLPLQLDQPMNQNNMDPARMQQWAQMRYGQNVANDMNHAKSVQVSPQTPLIFFLFSPSMPIFMHPSVGALLSPLFSPDALALITPSMPLSFWFRGLC